MLQVSVHLMMDFVTRPILMYVLISNEVISKAEAY